jgi:HK97 family phage prohead protease
MFPVNFEYPVDIVKSYEEEGRWVVEGYAATSDFDLQEDIITEEAIRASAKDLLENSTVLHNHNADDAICRVLDSRAHKRGLFLKIMISKTAPEIWQQIREGVLNKFSVRGKVLQARKQWVPELKRYARLIIKMRLLEVSLVAVPANPKARAIRWYIEKALDDFEKAGGRIEMSKGGPEMGEEKVVEGELLEAKGNPGGGEGEKKDEDAEKDKEKKAEKGFPPPEVLAREWSEHAEKAGLKDKGGDEAFEAWVAFCKQNRYPYPYPYPYPRPQSGARMRQIVELVDRLLKDEKDEARKKLLQQIRAIAAGAANAYPQPPAKKEETPAGAETPSAPPSGTAGADEDVEKAGRKISGARLARLKKLLDELKSLIAEVDSASAEEKKADAGNSDPDRLAEIEDVVAKVAKALGIPESKEGEIPNLARAVADLKKRLDDLENTPASKTSLDGQEDLADEEEKDKGKDKDKDSVWKGLL